LLMRILGNHVVDVAVNGRRERQEDAYSRTIHFTCRTIVDTTASYELVSKMRASFWVISAMNCACRSVGKHGKGSVTISTGLMPAP
ncbi:hypothetical protein AB9F45_37225, partial [Rhizobium leguminosarum]